MRIGIIGNGVVGAATAHAFRKHGHEVRCYDHDYTRSEVASASNLLRWAEITFICLPTPQKADSLECDTSAIEDFLFSQARVLEVLGNQNLVLRSTVPIGFTRRMRERFNLPNLVHSPEFLTARTAKEDAENPTRCIIGEPGFTADSEQTECADKLQELYEDLFPQEDATEKIYFMTSDESEAVKLMQNTFSAVKISLFNEFRTLSDKLEMHWPTILSALLAGGWINPMHTEVPGPDGKRGFGGACLPKDLANFIHCCNEAGVDRFSLVAVAAFTRNEHFDRKGEK